MKSKNSTKRPKMLLNQGLLTALGSAVAATQAEGAVLSVGPVTATNGFDTVDVATTAVLTLEHSRNVNFATSSSYIVSGTFPSKGDLPPGFNPGSTFSGSVSGTWMTPGNIYTASKNRRGVVSPLAGQAIGSALRGTAAFPVGAAQFNASNPASVYLKTSSSGSGANVYAGGGAIIGSDNYIPVKFTLDGGASTLYGLAHVKFDVFDAGSKGYTKLLNFWYSDNGSEVRWDGSQLLEVSSIPEPGSLVSTAMLLGLAAFVRKRHQRPDAQSLGALAAGVGGLIARENESAA
jgi:hypothetical protein